MDSDIARLHKCARALNSEPGVYIMKNRAGEIIYVGKAKNLRNRVSSYFRALDKHTPKVLAMVQQANYFETIVTASEFEALVLECSLIKLHNPRYNILLKDDKGYSYLRVDGSDFPRITEVKQVAEDGAQYIGPYMSSWVVKQMADEVNKTFGLPTCQRIFPRDFKKARPCLNLHLGQCMGVCRGNIPSEEYKQFVLRAVDTLKGKSEEAVRLLTQQMEQSAEQLDFERAARCRDRLRAIERFAQKQRMVYAGMPDEDVLAFVQSGEDVALAVLRFRGERLTDKLDFIFQGEGSTEDVRAQFLTRYYSDLQHELPPRLVLDEEPPDRELTEQLLSQRLGKKLELLAPKRGDALKLVELARLNAAEQLSSRATRTGREVAALDELKKLLGLPSPPDYIEAYDISNIGSGTIVGAMTVFESGRPKKSAYKRFAMKDIHAPDDYASMAQMLTRRFTHYLDAAEKDEGFKRLPDLLLIDGGKGQLSVVKSVLDQLNIPVPAFGMVKDDRHRTRAITAEGGEIAISSLRQVFSLITSIQDETHRFAVEYARGSHKKTAFEMSLTTVAGIGPARATALFRHFKTKKAILSATEEQLLEVQGMNRTAAVALLNAVKGNAIS